MIYTLNKNKLKPGDVLHCYSNGILAKLIKWFTKSRVNHTAIVIDVWGELFIVDAQKDGVNPRPFKEWTEKYNYTYEITRPKKFTPLYKKRVASKWGNTPYDFASLLIWQPLYILTGKWHGRSKKDAEKRMYCSEYIAWIFDIPNYWEMSPEAVYQYMKKNFKQL